MDTKKILSVNGREVSFNDERNLLEVIRKANIEIPTFCYHSELSVYGACRLCIVDVDGRGVISSCSIKPEPGMKIKTHTKEIRDIRKISIELLLANHTLECTTCSKSAACKLQEIANKLGVTSVRFKRTDPHYDIDLSSNALVRDPNKCILCGDCVRACDEIQGIGAIDFVGRGSDVTVQPAFGKDLAEVECVDCGQCARVCPTGAITPKSEIDLVWKALDNPKKVVIAQIAPAVRVAIGEMFNMRDGELLTGQVVAALKQIGFSKVFDTSFAADLTVVEESNEFLNRVKANEKMPLITSCCSAWVKYAEQYYPEYLENLSTCKSPQQMMGAVIKEVMPAKLGVKKEDVVVVSIMPCTAKKFEARRFQEDMQDVDIVLTTQELGLMIKQAGLYFEELNPESFDLPFGFKTGAGVLFGNSGGVSEAVLRYVNEEINGKNSSKIDFAEVRGNNGVKVAKIQLNGKEVTVAVVYGLKNTKELLNKMKTGEAHYDFIEVMACPGGCVGGAGQPVTFDDAVRKKRAKGIYDIDKMLQLHKSQENPYVKDLYSTVLLEPNSEKAHHLLHTHYKNRRRILDEEISLIYSDEKDTVDVNVCVGTNCFVKGSQTILNKLLNYIDNNDLNNKVNVKATFCLENCDSGPSVTVGGEVISKADFEGVRRVIMKKVQE